MNKTIITLFKIRPAFNKNAYFFLHLYLCGHSAVQLFNLPFFLPLSLFFLYVQFCTVFFSCLCWFRNNSTQTQRRCPGVEGRSLITVGFLGGFCINFFGLWS